MDFGPPPLHLAFSHLESPVPYLPQGLLPTVFTALVLHSLFPDLEISATAQQPP